MTMPTNVTVCKLAKGDQIVVSAPHVDLGDAAASRKLNDLLALLREGQDMYLVRWQGSKIPRGVTVSGHEITWTQHGFVSGIGGLTVGTYERLLEFGGESGEEHSMVIYIDEAHE